MPDPNAKIIVYNQACRSRNSNDLKTYQTKIDKLKPEDIIKRPYVPDDKVDWMIPFPDYKTVEYTTGRILKDKPV